MSQLSTSLNRPAFNSTEGCTDFFQQRLQHLLTYWRDHEAVAELQIAVLDKERTVILKLITLGLDIKPLWYIVRPLIINLTPYMERRGHWEEWHGILERAIAVAQRNGDIDHEVTLTALLARLCQRMSRPKEVVKNYRRVIWLARQTGNRFEEARACSNLGYLYIDGGRWWRSEVLSQHALMLFEALDSDHGRAHTHNHLGLLYLRSHQYQWAEEHLIQACNIWSSMGEGHDLYWGYANLGLLYIERKISNKAISYLEKALHFAEKTGDENGVARVWSDMGLAYTQIEEFDTAKQYLEQAKAVYDHKLHSLELARVLQNLGNIGTIQQQWTDARAYLDAALKTVEQTDAPEAKIRIRFDLLELAIRQGTVHTLNTQLDEVTQLVLQHTNGAVQKFYLGVISDQKERMAKQ